MFKRIISLVLSFVLITSVICVGLTVYANEPESENDDAVIYRYQVISDNTSGIHISGVTAICSAVLGAKYSTNLSITMELQKLSSGSYSTIKTWSKTNPNTTSLGIEGTRLINVLSTYRLKTTFTAGNETVVVYSYPS